MQLLDDSLTGPEGSLFDGDRYEVLRLIMVNSGSSAYVELPLDQTAALLGSNNQGKTSGLHTLKLFLLPEVNFRNCENKFGFASKDREYTGLESYRYYFPSASSFIILEASNPRGEFCIVLYQSNQELGYNRLAVPRPYEHIKHLFWDENSGANQGVGSHPSDMDLSAITSRLKKLGGRTLNDVASIREALYTRVDPSDDDTRFCLMPLVQSPSQHMMRSIKALLQLSFDIKGADHKNLPQAIANIIDADLSSQKETISIDFRRIQDDRERLSQNQREIRAIRDHMDDWNSLRKNYQVSYQEQSLALRNGYQSLLAALAQHSDSIDPQLSDARAEHESIQSRFKDVNGQLDSIRSQFDEAKGIYGNLSKDVSDLGEAIALANDVVEREAPAAGSSDPDRVQAWLKECLQEVQQELIEIQNLEQTQNALQRELSRKPQIQQDIARATAVLQQQKGSTLSYLDKHSALVLNSLNGGFCEMVTVPSDEQKAALQPFTQLFTVNEQGRLLFCGEPMPRTQVVPFDALAVKEAHTARLHKLEDDLQNCERRIEEYRRALTGSDEQRKESLKEKQTEIGEINREIEVISGLAYTSNRYAQKKPELEALALYLEEQGSCKQTLTEQLQQLKADRENSRELVHSLEIQKKSLQGASESLDTLQKLTGFQQIPAANTEAYSPQEIALKANELIRLYHNEFVPTRERCIAKFQLLISEGIAGLDPQMAFRVDLKGKEFDDAYQKLKAEFENIDSRERDHRSQVQNHNHDTGRQISLLDKMDLAIRNFQDRINGELSHIRISNLTGVRVEIGTLDSFNTLRHELKDHGTESDRLMKESFYNRLQDFCEKYLMTGHNAGRLDLERIVKSVKFIYQINGRDEVTPQSNGTSSMVNAVLLSILMHKLVPEDVVFALPVIFDEVGSLDDSNLAELRRIVEEHNFQLLVANPTNQGNIAQHIGVWHDLFLHQVTEGSPIGKCLAIYTGSSESLKDIVDTVELAVNEPETEDSDLEAEA
ncbi:hypothetical protein [Parendozoicomonas haliclonae]|uniref:Chromosome partition protein Smc n=1 Tax=Parendozoicomonas haliclonae TaxID=1960125 RepID=A0A1X7APL1_9GAMM|nr:hypothetical protein [Parendozoicomonas haliclonae]SMA49220.1 Chromosome partition protein Smc [Parendozoicomonas haliclonae]